MSKLGTVLAFFVGAAVGGGMAWYYAERKYSCLAEQEINSVKEAFARHERQMNAKRQAESPPTPAASVKAPEKESIEVYAQRMQDNEGRIPYATVVMPREELDDQFPYVISPDEFGEMEEYTKVSLTYFDDDILSDENGIIVDDPEELIGDALDHFGEYEDDSVFVRSDVKRCDYEILRDLRSYAEFRTTLPPKI